MAPYGLERRTRVAVEDAQVSRPGDLAPLFHRLNNQLGVILAHAELLETKATDPALRSRASQVVASVLEAMTAAREIRARVDSDQTP